MHDEGYIKFKAHWTQRPPQDKKNLVDLLHWREQMYRAQLIGAYPDGIGFGNISCRHQGNTFLISGSATGNFATLDAPHFALVTAIDIDQNQVFCEGPIIASSESMSHAVIYQTCPEVHAVIHVHHLGLWEKWKFQLPTTIESAAYGTPEMAHEIIRLLQESTVRQKEKTFIMAGHREGIFAFGKTLQEAGQSLLQLQQHFNQNKEV